jgi:hypothetical protein
MRIYLAGAFISRTDLLVDLAGAVQGFLLRTWMLEERETGICSPDKACSKWKEGTWLLHQ